MTRHSYIHRLSMPGLLAAMLSVALWAGPSAAPASGKIFLTVEEALALAYPDCEVERTTVFLDEDQLERAREVAGVEVESGLVYPYRADCGGNRGGASGGIGGGASGGTAYFDSHRVRTLPETVMVALDADGNVLRVEVLAFREPEDYIPREIWYRQFDGETLDDELDVKRDIRSVTGATLTVRATTQAVRRVLAIHQILSGDAPEAAAE